MGEVPIYFLTLLLSLTNSKKGDKRLQSQSVIIPMIVTWQSEKEEILKTLKENKKSKVILRLIHPFEFNIL